MRAVERLFERATRAGVFIALFSSVGVGEPFADVTLLRVAAVGERVRELDAAFERTADVRILDLSHGLDREPVFRVTPRPEGIVVLEEEAHLVEVLVARLAIGAASDGAFEALARGL